MKKEGFFHLHDRFSTIEGAFLVALLFVALSSSKVTAAVSDKRPELSFLEVKNEVEFVKKAYDYLTTLNRDTISFKEEAGVIVQEMFHFESFCRLAIQDISPRMTLAQIGQFQSLFEKVFTANMAKKGIKFADKKLESVKYESLEDEENFSTVALRGKSEKGDVTIKFDLTRSGGGWKIVDLSVNGATLSRNYRGQFNRIFRVENYEGLMSRMEKKLASLSEYAKQ